MAETYNLAAKKREKTKNSARDVREDGGIPAVVYGHGTDPIALSIDYSEFLKLFRQTGQASLIDLTVEGESVKVLVHAYDMHPVKDTFQHVDFFAVNLKEETTVHVPLVFEGESEAVKTLGGIFVSSHTELLIRCLPSEIPHDIVVDISAIKELHDHITIADLNLSDRLEVMHLDEGTTICSVSGRAVEEEEGDAAVAVELEEETAESTTEE